MPKEEQKKENQLKKLEKGLCLNKGVKNLYLQKAKIY